ncbi:MAG: YdhR family protein [Candidatus Thiodiazotropha taylori]
MNATQSKMHGGRRPISRREVIADGTTGLFALLAGGLGRGVDASTHSTVGTTTNVAGMPGAFLYTEVQASTPFERLPWEERNPVIASQEGFISKTWLSGRRNLSMGGFYSFESIAAARRYAAAFFPEAQRRYGNAHTSRIFDASVTQEASIDINSPHFSIALGHKPGAYVYTEVQVSVPFEQFPWRKRNRELKKIPGLLGKTWLSGLNTQTLGGFDIFDSLENAERFAIERFPETAAKLGAAFTTRIFDASVTEAASRGIGSPMFTMQREVRS